MLVEIGALSNIYCPICDKENSFEEIECEYTVEDDILRMDSLVECEECGSSFKIIQRFTLNFLDCSIQGITRPKREDHKTGSCPYGVFFCKDCYKNNSEMCPHWEE